MVVCALIEGSKVLTNGQRRKKGQFNPGGPFYIIAVALGPPMNTFGGCALIRAWNPVVGQTDKKGVIS